jgi:hypothetical protein
VEAAARLGRARLQWCRSLILGHLRPPHILNRGIRLYSFSVSPWSTHSKVLARRSPYSGRLVALLIVSSVLQKFFERHFNVTENGAEKSWPKGLAGMHRYSRDPSVGMLQENVAAASSNCFEAQPFQEGYTRPSGAAGGSYRDLLYADKLQ